MAAQPLSLSNLIFTSYLLLFLFKITFETKHFSEIFTLREVKPPVPAPVNTNSNKTAFVKIYPAVHLTVYEQTKVPNSQEYKPIERAVYALVDTGSLFSWIEASDNNSISYPLSKPLGDRQYSLEYDRKGTTEMKVTFVTTSVSLFDSKNKKATANLFLFGQCRQRVGGGKCMQTDGIDGLLGFAIANKKFKDRVRNSQKAIFAQDGKRPFRGQIVYSVYAK